MPSSRALVQGTGETLLQAHPQQVGAGTRPCPRSRGVASGPLAHPPSRACFLLASWSLPAGRGRGRSGLWRVLSLPQFTLQGSASPRLIPQVLPSAGRDSGPSRLEDGSARVGFRVLGCPVSPAPPLTPAHHHSQMRGGRTTGHRCTCRWACFPAGGRGTLPVLTSRGGGTEREPACDARAPRAPSAIDVRLRAPPSVP